MCNAELAWLDGRHNAAYEKAMTACCATWRTLDAIRERTQIVQDELTNALSDRLNKNMYILSVIAAIFLPLGFLTGLLGINVGGIPDTDNTHAST